MELDFHNSAIASPLKAEQSHSRQTLIWTVPPELPPGRDPIVGFRWLGSLPNLLYFRLTSHAHAPASAAQPRAKAVEGAEKRLLSPTISHSCNRASCIFFLHSIQCEQLANLFEPKWSWTAVKRYEHRYEHRHEYMCEQQLVLFVQDELSKLQLRLCGRSSYVTSHSHRGAPQFSPPQTPENISQSTIRPHHDRRRQRHPLGPNSTDPSPSTQQSTLLFAPSPPSLSESTTEIYGPDRLFGPPLARGYGASIQPAHPHPTPAVRFDESQLAMFAAEAENTARMQGIKDELTIAAGKVTPGVDDTPYIQYALDALTQDQDRDMPPRAHFPSGTTDNSVDYPEPRRLQDEEMGYAPMTPPEPAYVEDRLPMERNVFDDTTPDSAPEATPETVLHHTNIDPASPSSPSSRRSSSLLTSDLDAGRWLPVDKTMMSKFDPHDKRHPPLDYKTPMLRPFSMIIMMTLCLLMIVALIFSAVYSKQDTGLTPYPGSIYSGQYFLFRILPQLLAAVILLYAQNVVLASMRTLPFVAMASENPQERQFALFENRYPKSFLWPQLSGPWQVRLFSVATWLANFTLPLQSTTFTCIFDKGHWIWAAVQGIVWTLVVLYLVLFVATAILMTFWFRKWTGLKWDVRSIGDLVPLLNQSNAMGSWRAMNGSATAAQMKQHMNERKYDRLGYWQMEDRQTEGIWYGIGTSAYDAQAINIMAKTHYNDISSSSSARHFDVEASHSRYSYLPWALRTFTVIPLAILIACLFVALVAVSFAKPTRLDNGFLPLLSAKPGHGAFSAANFLYGFIPSLIGMIMFLGFQSLDLSLRVLHPWQELSKPTGATAQKSILADYAACLPFHSTWKAAKNGHWRVAFVSLMAVLFVFIPILAGGLFMALTHVSAERQVRMFPNMPVFGLLLAFLVLYLGSLCLMIPNRKTLRLPHPVSSLADVISFCSAEETTQDPAFRSVRSRADLEYRLGRSWAGPREQQSTVWSFGYSAGRDERRLSVRPLQRFTEKRTRTRTTRYTPEDDNIDA
ncbi:hypothetical protein G7046_g1457 [Stylonectria norvegica]|nr:hypothetical protein G7046_g1457 [Stylonectria norvegica]